MKTGMDHNGREIIGIAYLRQRIEDVFKFPRGQVPLSRGYGSDLHELLDRNVDDDFVITAYEMITDAFTNPANGLEDCLFKRMTTTVQNDQVTFNVWVDFEGEEVELKGISHARN